MKEGEQFIHKKYSDLHTSKAVEHEQERRKRASQETSQKPADKLSDWFNVLERTHSHHDNPAAMRRIKEYYHKKHVIRPEDIPESYFENQTRMMREQGHGDVEITDELKKQGIEVIIADQKSTLDNWIDYFTNPDSSAFPTWAKYWAFTSMLKLGSYDKEKKDSLKENKIQLHHFQI